MPLTWRGLFGRSAEPERMSAPAPKAKFSLGMPQDLISAITGGGNLAAPISRNEAMSVPAVLRARNLICGSLATLPLCVYGPDKRKVTDTTYLVGSQIDEDVANSVVMAQTLEDLVFSGIAWWRITAWGWHGYPTAARWIPNTSVMVASGHSLLPSQMVITKDELFPAPGDGGVVYVDGRPVPDRELIRFDSPNPPLLKHAARAIRTCLLLDSTAALYARDPQALAYFTPADGAEQLTDDEIQAELDKWEAARAARATGYVNAALKLNQAGWNPEQLQLASARQHAVLEIARATGVDPEYLGVSTTSRTYANIEDQRRDLLTFTLAPYVAAIEDRLSMRDVLPRGYCAEVNFDEFLRADTKTRMETYQLAKAVGAYTADEIRDMEDLPPLTPAQQAASNPAPMPAQPQEPAPSGVEQSRRREASMSTQRFASGEQTVRVRFTAADTEDFQVDTQRRTITGLMVPWGVVGDNGNGRWRFAKDSIVWSNPSRVKLNTEHSTNLVAVGTRFQSTDAGLMGTFKFGRSPEATRALEDADDGILDGLSVEVDFAHPDSVVADPSDQSVNLVRNATLRGAALTGDPAFTDARVTSVKASRNQGGSMPENTGTTQPPAETFDFEGHLTAAVDRMAETHQRLTTSLAESLGDSFSAAMRTALEDLPNPQGPNGPQPVRASRYTVTREEPVYSMDGRGPSLVRDGWYSVRHRDHDAMERLRRFTNQTEDLAKYSRSVMSFAGGGRAQFTTSSTSTASQLIPPGYRPDLFVPLLAQGRPMVNAISAGTIENATPFVVPIFGSMSGATGTHSEGTNPTDGTLTFTTKTVTPTTVDGKLLLTRELVDSSNPAIDQIALQAMRESYARQTEAAVYALLNGANGAAGTITSGFVPSGAQAATFASTGGTPIPEMALIKGIRQQLARYPFNRFMPPEIGLMGQNATVLIAGTSDSTGRPLFPSIAPYNAAGLGNAKTQGWEIDTVPFVPAWAMTGVAAGDSQIMVLNSLDAWAWESPTLLFQFLEKQGPALIEMALFGYFATHLLRPVGLSGIRIT